MEYLYNCRGCKKPDKEYPDEEVECDECAGEGLTAYVNEDGRCPACDGHGSYIPRTSVQYHRWARADAYGIYTGLYCDECYDDSNIYTYRKDEYYDEGYAGEQLYPDE